VELNFFFKKKDLKKDQSQHVLTFKTRDPNHELGTDPVEGEP
jgi:hypothetical protein